jgi:hypothetical protein
MQPIEAYELVSQLGTVSAAAQYLLAQIRSGAIPFPYQKLFRGFDLQNDFAELRQVQAKSLGLTEDYELNNYAPKYGSYLPPRFRGRPTILKVNGWGIDRRDALTDYFNEDVRSRAYRNRYGESKSVMDIWNDDAAMLGILEYLVADRRESFNYWHISMQDLAEKVGNSIQEVDVFSPTLARSVVRTILGPNVAGKKWLDISSGYGSMLLAAMSLDMDYQGYDPDVNLQPSYSQMIAQFGNNGRSYSVSPEPFEKATLQPESYDIIFTEPPMFDSVIYAKGQTGQTSENYPVPVEWVVYFWFASLRKAWAALKKGGYLAFYMYDTAARPICEPSNIFVENSLPGSSWEGVIGFIDKTNTGILGLDYNEYSGVRTIYGPLIHPIWVWKKAEESMGGIGPTVNRWISPTQTVPRKLFNMFPLAQITYVGYLVGTTAPEYKKKQATIWQLHKLMDRLGVRYLTHNWKKTPDLILYCLLESLQLQGFVQFMRNPAINTMTVEQLEELTMRDSPNYKPRKDAAEAVRAHVRYALPNDSEKINKLLADDLQIVSLLEEKPSDKVVAWCTVVVRSS